MTTSARSIGFLSLFLICVFHPLFSDPAVRPAEASGHHSDNRSDNHAVQFAMKNVMYHYSENVAVHIVELQGELVPVKSGFPVIFDDKYSFSLALSSAEIEINCNSLAHVLNQNVFASAESPIKNLSIQSRGNQLVVKGKFHLKGDVPFEASGTLSASEDGKIRLHTEHVKAAHLPVKGLLDLLGIDLAGLINTKRVHGVSVDKDDLILDPEQILPAPNIKGKVTAVRIQGNEIVQVFGTRHSSSIAEKQPGNYMAFRHGDLRFGKLTMRDADLIMIDMDPRDPYDFYLDHYQDQLVGGYTKSTPEFGLRVHTPDYDKLPNRRAAKHLINNQRE